MKGKTINLLTETVGKHFGYLAICNYFLIKHMHTRDPSLMHPFNECLWNTHPLHARYKGRQAAKTKMYQLSALEIAILDGRLKQ